MNYALKKRCQSNDSNNFSMNRIFGGSNRIDGLPSVFGLPRSWSIFEASADRCYVTGLKNINFFGTVFPV